MGTEVQGEPCTSIDNKRLRQSPRLLRSTQSERRGVGGKVREGRERGRQGMAAGAARAAATKGYSHDAAADLVGLVVSAAAVPRLRVDIDPPHAALFPVDVNELRRGAANQHVKGRPEIMFHARACHAGPDRSKDGSPSRRGRLIPAVARVMSAALLTRSERLREDVPAAHVLVAARRRLYPDHRVAPSRSETPSARRSPAHRRK